MMSITVSVDQVADAAYIRLSESAVENTVEVNDEVLVDLDSMRVVVGIELLQISAEIPFTELVEKFHVHSQQVELLRLLKPSIAQTVLSGGNDGVANPAPRSVLEAA